MPKRATNPNINLDELQKFRDFVAASGVHRIANQDGGIMGYLDAYYHDVAPNLLRNDKGVLDNIKIEYIRGKFGMTEEEACNMILGNDWLSEAFVRGSGYVDRDMLVRALDYYIEEGTMAMNEDHLFDVTEHREAAFN